ncbi:5-oxoprolinase subunit B family protein [Arthrobacter sp. UM1]|uniref:5-oxoprolinase subunit B family protein n=1 Tax=Arthrobacter sp. UM1 TaxID=2766776 RepID=UPI001CF6BB0E|nr:allophanate hydrolase subunit 1 [Arthrobacter sp. UM1]MCB4207862.1 allophanate hydrolase subunit 1 [Arthrobacter sp. UM1]
MRQKARYSFGGDEFLFVEVYEAMSLEAYFKVMALAEAVKEAGLPGLVDVCPANASLLIRFDPDGIRPEELRSRVQELEESAVEEAGRTVTARVVEIPVWYDDPYTSEVEQRFRKGYHQDPEGTDLDYAAKVNGLKDAAEFIERHHSQPWMVTMVGFVAGLPFMFQLVDQDQQMEVPKYLSPRTDTPKLTVGHGGSFACIYSVRGAGGYQMFGVAAAPIFEPEQKHADFEDFMIFFKPGDVVKFRPVDETEYREIQKKVEDGSFRFKTAEATFDVDKLLANPTEYNTVLTEALDVA